MSIIKKIKKSFFYFKEEHPNVLNRQRNILSKKRIMVFIDSRRCGISKLKKGLKPTTCTVELTQPMNVRNVA